MNGFTIYKEYYDLISLLSEKEQQELLLAITKYMFEDTMPTLNDKQMKIFNNLKRPLNKSKKRSKAGSNNNTNENQNENKTKSNENQNENKAKSNENQNQNKNETKQKQTKNKTKTHQDVNVSNYVSNYVVNGNVNGNVNSLLKEYLELRQKNKYPLSEIIVTRLCNKLNEYGKDDKEKEEIIMNAINGAWKDFYPIKVKAKSKSERSEEVLAKERERLRREAEERDRARNS